MTDDCRLAIDWLAVPPDSPRIAELRRRVDADPSSIAFAQLAEEYRRAGNYEAAEHCCRTGLTRHPGYLSARVTLGRTLIELNKLDEAEQELDFVLKSAPDNLAAIRGVAEIHRRRGNLELALDYYRRALPLARHDPEIEETVRQIHRDLGAAKSKEQSAGLSFKEAQDEFLSALSRLTPVAPRVAPMPPAAPPPEPQQAAPPAAAPPIDFDGLLATLGAPNHQPPPMVEALLSESRALSVAAAPVLPEVRHEAEPATEDDALADLERNLRAFDDQTRTDEGDTAVEHEILDELEAWLAALRR